MRGQTLAGSGQDTQQSSHAPSHPALPQLPWGHGHPSFATAPALNTSFPWSFGFHFCPLPYLQQLLPKVLAVLAYRSVPRQTWTLCLPGWEGRGDVRGCGHPPASTACCLHTLPPTYLLLAKTHIQSTLNINTTNAISGSSRSFAHATSLNSLKMVSVHLFHFTRTCHHVASVHSFPLSFLLRSTLTFHLGLTKESKSVSWTSHTLEWSPLPRLGFYFWSGGCMQEHYS